MTEAEWLACRNPVKMLQLLGPKASERKLRLFACACCRRISQMLPDEANLNLVAAVEEYPDGTFDDPKLNAAIVASSRREGQWAHNAGYWAVKYLGRSYYKVTPLESAIIVALKVVQRAREAADGPAEERAQAALVREVFGNPFCTVTIEPNWLRWNGGVVLRLARSICDDRAFERLPRLAAALKEAGCGNADILAHCHEPGPHVRGCWVIDLLRASGQVADC